VSFSPMSSFCWFQPQSSGSLLNTLGSSLASVPASIPSFSSFAALPPAEEPTAAETTSAASNAPALIGSDTLGALISMQSDSSPGADTARASEPASDETGSAVATSPPADPPITDEPSPAVHADGGAPVGGRLAAARGDVRRCERARCRGRTERGTSDKYFERRTARCRRQSWLCATDRRLVAAAAGQLGHLLDPTAGPAPVRPFGSE